MLLLLLFAATPDAELASAVEKLAPEVRGAKGLIDLLNGRKSAARLGLADQPELAAYLAMAELEGAGGLGRAREVLAKAAAREAAPSTLFLAALAFYVSGDLAKADRLLAKAIADSPSALDEAFAPDPAVALVRIAAKSGPKEQLARLLLEHGRKSAAIELAAKADARGVLAEAWAPIDPRRALRYADAPALQARLHWKLGEKDKAKAALQKAEGSDPDLERLRAEILLDEQKPAEALDAAEEAARLDPKSDDSVRLVTEALFATRAFDRASAFAEELLKRKPIEIDPYGLLAKIQTERKHEREVPALEARSKGHQQERAKLEQAKRRREAILSAVRDAESGLGVTGLDAVRGADPQLSLPIDLALAKLGQSGTARAARERILAACADDLRKMLSPRGTWDRVRLEISPYGKVQKVDAALSGADPARCGGKVLRK